MKQCPNCKTVYTDDSLKFCLNDGADLIFANDTSDAAETVRMSFGSEPLRVNIPQDSTPTVFSASPPIPQVSQSQPATKAFGIIIAAVIGFFALLAIAGIGGFVFYRQSGGQNSSIVAASPMPTTKPPASPNIETEKLKNDLANLQKQLDEQKKQKSTSSVNNSSPPAQTLKIAKANSPRDGFLALRSEPDSETGYRIAQIPHGATLTVLNCPKPSNVGKIPGRWCKVIYEGQSGWAFDAFMTFQ